MSIEKLINQIKTHKNIDKVGMILTHNGIVRATTRDGRSVSGLKIKVDHEKLKQVVEKHKKSNGIIEILVEINEDKDLKIGDDIMFLVVAGDIRDNVILALSNTLNDIKAYVTQKTEFFV